MKKRLPALLLAAALLLSAPIPARAAGGDEALTGTRTDIAADSVMNTSGCASLRIDPVWSAGGEELLSAPQAALIDGTGSFLFPYRDTWLRYRVSDGIVSLTDSAYRRYWTPGPGGARREDRPGFYRLDGSTAFSFDYLSASPMMEGVAFVLDSWQEGSACLIDRSGTVVYSFPADFAAVSGAGEGTWHAEIGCLNTVGWFSEGLMACYTGQKATNGWTPGTIYYMDASGSRAVTLYGYKNAYPFHEGLAAVVSAYTGLAGYIDRTGTQVIPCVYGEAGDFSDGLAPVSRDGKWGYIDRSGQVVIPLEYDAAYGAGSGLAAVMRDGKCGLVDYTGRVALPLEYDDISSFEGGVAYGIQDRMIYIIQKTGTSADPRLAGASAWAEEELGAALEAGLVPEELVGAYTQAARRVSIAQLFIRLLEGCTGRDIGRLMAERGLAADPDAFSDTRDSAVLAANALGILRGMGDGSFAPQGTLTRAQIAAVSAMATARF